MADTLAATAAPSPAPAPVPAPPPNPPGTDGPARNVFAYPGYVKLLTASLLGALGDRFYQGLMIATANEIFQGKTDELKELGSRQNLRVQIFSILPMLILYALVGSWVDSCDRRRLLTWIEAIKVAVVLGFVWLLRDLTGLRDAGSVGTIPAEWTYGLALVVLLNAITVPFSPARASIVPDVLPEERRSLGASLIATAGLVSYLIGGLAGMKLARAESLGPVNMAFAASALFLISSLIFRMLPENVTVPNTQKKGDGTGHAAQKMSFGEYLAEQYDGFKYCVKHPSLIALVFFETVFWTMASMVLVFINYYANHVLVLTGGEITSFTSNGLGLAGLGIVVGAIGAGKTQRVVSPIFAYTPAFLLVGIGMLAFTFPPSIEPLNGVATMTTSAWFFPFLLMMAVGGGMMLGRVDADILAIADERYRGRIFALKAVAFGICTLATTYYLSEQLSPAAKGAVIAMLPKIILCLLPLVFVFGWLVDAAIWRNYNEIPAPNLRMRMQFGLLAILSLILAKLLFRYSTVGANKVPKTGPVILVANHGSFLDPILLGAGCPRMVQYLMYTSYYTSIAHPIFRWLSAIPVDEKKNLQALKTGVASLQNGSCIGIFPEGQVAYEKKLYPPQGGAMFLAQRSGATVIPVALKGNWDAFPRAAKFPSFKKITAIYGEPFTVPKGSSKEEVAKISAKMMESIAAMLGVPPPDMSAPYKPGDGAKVAP